MKKKSQETVFSGTQVIAHWKYFWPSVDCQTHEKLEKLHLATTFYRDPLRLSKGEFSFTVYADSYFILIFMFSQCSWNALENKPPGLFGGKVNQGFLFSAQYGEKDISFHE